MPRQEKYWTIPQTLLWIITRDLERVSSVPDENRDNIRIALSDVFEGQDDPRSVSLNQCFQESLSDFKRAAGNEDIRTYGKKDHENPHQIIPPIEWHGLSINGVRGDLRLQAGNKTAWYSPLVEQADAVRTWPLRNQPAKKRRGREAGDGSYRDEAKIAYMNEIISNGSAKSINDAAHKAATKYGLSGASYESDVDRLRRKYRKTYRSE